MSVTMALHKYFSVFFIYFCFMVTVLRAQLESRVLGLADRIYNIQTNNERLKFSTDLLETENVVRGEKFKLLQQKVNITATYIGFGAYRTDSTDVPFHERIVYNSVTAYLGYGYDSETGVFTCPLTGYYYFTVMAFSTLDFNHAQLVIGDEPQLTALSYRAYWDQGTIAQLILCQQGTEVWVRNNRDQSQDFAQKPDDPSSQDDTYCNGFMGFLVSLI